MFLTDINLSNFRSYTKSSFTFHPHSTVIIGPNTSGKTNILEAMYFLAVGKSFRAEKDSEVITWNKEVATVKANVSNVQGEIELEIRFTPGVVSGLKTPIKRLLVNKIARHMVNFTGIFRAVLFWPEDLELVIDSPSLRRRYLDFVLTQVDWEYRRSLVSYERGIRQRNKVLEQIREGQASKSQLLFWDQLAIKEGSCLTNKREAFIESINRNDKPFGNYNLHYDKSYISESRLAKYKDAEIASATTLVGPHRDDFQFFEKERNLSKYGSRGEQRLAVLWLKLAELDYIEKTTGERPVLLLDDIFSELDHKHREEVIRVMALQQTILTTADAHFLPEELKQTAKVVELSNNNEKSF